MIRPVREALSFLLQMAMMTALLVLVLTSCSEKRPSWAMNEEDLESFLYDYHMTRASIAVTNKISQEKMDKFMDYLYKKHGITQEDLDTSMVYYAAHPDIMTRMYQRLNNRVSLSLSNVNQKIERRERSKVISTPGDSINLWNGLPVYHMGNTGNSDLMTFRMKTDQNFMTDDTIRLEMDSEVLGLKDSLSSPAVLSLSVNFQKKDTIVTRQVAILQSGHYSLTISNDTLGSMREIYGYAFIDSQKDSTSLFLSRPRLMRYHRRGR